jgi:hypothetical protein
MKFQSCPVSIRGCTSTLKTADEHVQKCLYNARASYRKSHIGYSHITKVFYVYQKEKNLFILSREKTPSQKYKLYSE